MAQTVTIPGVGDVEFPDGMSSADVSAAAKKLYESHQPPEKQSSVGGVEGAIAANAIPMMTRGVEELATNPRLAGMGSKVGQALGGLAGMAKAGPIGASQGLWAGGKGGWLAAKLAQAAASPVAKGMAAIEPYARGILQTASGVQGGLDLAQMDDPTRRDIGVMGVGASSPTPTSDQVRQNESKVAPSRGGPSMAQQWQAVADEIQKLLHGGAQ